MEQSLQNLKVTHLRKIAQKYKIKGRSRLNKAPLIDLILINVSENDLQKELGISSKRPKIKKPIPVKDKSADKAGTFILLDKIDTGIFGTTFLSRNEEDGELYTLRKILTKEVIPFSLISMLGKGAFGTTFLALNAEDDKLYALKQISREVNPEKATRILLREMEALTLVNKCPNVLVYHELITTEKNYYLVTDYVRGVTMDKFIRNIHNYNINDEDILNLLIQLTRALSCVHERGLAHRDLKDSNIIINPAESPPEATIIDFGLGCLMELPPEPSKTDKTLWCKHLKGGNRRYYPPDIFNKEYKFPDDFPYWALDVFALGLIFIRLTTGKTVSAARSPKTISTGNTALNRIISRMLTPHPPERPKMSYVLQALDGINNPRFHILHK